MSEKIQNFYEAFRFFSSQISARNIKLYDFPNPGLLISMWISEWARDNEEQAQIIEKVISEQKKALEENEETPNSTAELIYERMLAAPQFQSGEFQNAVTQRGVYVVRKMSELMVNLGKPQEAETLTRFVEEQETSITKGPEKK